jgi:FkbM family methyltransferase
LVAEHPAGFKVRFRPTNAASDVWAKAAPISHDLRFQLNFLAAGDVFVDAGANIGLHTLAAARVVGESGHVYAFEAHPRTFAYLQENVRLNNAANVNAFGCALGDHQAEVGMTDLIHTDDQNFVLLDGSGVRVPLRRLDDLIPEGVSPALLKVDVEGFELPVLRGAATVLGSTECVQVEVWDRMSLRYGNRLQDTLDFLRASGFSIFRLNAAHTLFATVTSDASGEQGDIYVCVRDPARLTARTGIPTEAT